MERRHAGPVSDGCGSAGRSRQQPRAAWSSGHRGSGRSRQLEPPFCAGRIGVDLRDGAVDQDVFEVWRVSQNVEQPFPDTCVRPAAEPCMHSIPLAEHLRQVAPAGRVTSHPQDRIHEQPIVDAAASSGPSSARKMTFDPFPLLVRQRASAQGLAPSPALNQNRNPNGSLNADRP